MYYYYEEDYVYRGLKTLLFGGTKKTVDNGTTVDENKCYCDLEFCPPSGVLDISKCQYGAPVFMSFPHFYQADPDYLTSVEGMKPDRDKHRFYIAVEPVSFFFSPNGNGNDSFERRHNHTNQFLFLISENGFAS